MSEPANKPHPPLLAGPSQLRRAIPPPVDLWPAVAARIDRSADSLDGRLRRLPEAVEPPRDGWPGIAARLDAARFDERPHRSRDGWAAAFACAGLAAIFAVLITIGARYARRPSPPATLPGALPVAARTADAWPMLQPLFVGAAEGGAAAGAAGAAARTLLRELELVRSQREAVQRAMQAHAGDADLRAVWRHAYEAELDLTAETERILTRYQQGYR